MSEIRLLPSTQSRLIMIPTSCPLVLEKIPANVALNPYFLFLKLNAWFSSSGLAKEAFPLNHWPFRWPLIPHGARRTFGLFLRRFTLPVWFLVTTLIFLPSIVNQTVVVTPSPFLFKVSRLIYRYGESVVIGSAEGMSLLLNAFLILFSFLMCKSMGCLTPQPGVGSGDKISNGNLLKRYLKETIKVIRRDTEVWERRMSVIDDEADGLIITT